MTQKTAGDPRLHPSLTAKRVEDAVNRQMTTHDNPGFCIKCGQECGGCEPDARRYECHTCGSRTVYGAAELFLIFVLH